MLTPLRPLRRPGPRLILPAVASGRAAPWLGAVALLTLLTALLAGLLLLRRPAPPPDDEPALPAEVQDHVG